MMDFLYRLAPPRENDASRAVAILPSRFADDSPLRAAIGQPRPMQRMDDEDSSVSLDGAPAPNPLTAESRPVAAGPRSHPPPREPGELPSRRKGRDVPSAPHSPARPAAPDFDAPSPLRGVQHRLERSKRAASMAPSSLDTYVAAPAALANDGRHSAAAPAGPVRVESPLSEASLAQRVLHARDERPVIHVTIDRIDVRAPAAVQRPAAPARPRAAATSLSLSDYLRARVPSRSGGMP